MDVVEKIQAVKTDKNDRPLEDIRILKATVTKDLPQPKTAKKAPQKKAAKRPAKRKQGLWPATHTDTKKPLKGHQRLKGGANNL